MYETNNQFYGIIAKLMKRFRTIIIASVALTACSASLDEGELDRLRGARSGLRVVMEILTGPTAQAQGSSSAVFAGIKSSTLFSDIARNEDFPSLPGRDIEINTDTGLIDAILSLLGTDLQQILNSSTNRAATLTSYIESLESHVEEAQIRERALEDKEDDLSDDQRRLRRTVRSLQKELDNAISEGKGRSATVLTEELIEKQTALGRAQTDLIVTEGLLNAFEDIIEPLEDRLNAVSLNREALIKGVRIFDTRGIEDLGIIEVEEGVRGRSRRRRR